MEALTKKHLPFKLIVGCCLFSALFLLAAWNSRHSEEGDRHAGPLRRLLETDEASAREPYRLSDTQKTRLGKLGYSPAQIAKFDSMSEAQITKALEAATEMALKKVKSRGGRGAGQRPKGVRGSRRAAVHARVSGVESAAPAPAEESSASEAPAPVVAEAAVPESVTEVVGNTSDTLPLEITTQLLRDLKPPDYCFTAVNGEKGFPSVRKFKNPPSDKTALRIAALLQQERKCWILTKKCALDPESTDNSGRPYVNKMKGAATLEESLPNLPELEKGGLGTCALVGTADNLVKKGWGPQIDAHDFVVRFNTVTKGYEADVGARVDGLWTKAGYNSKETSKIKPTRYHMIPKETPAGFKPIDGVPLMAYGPALNKWRPVAKEVYEIYKKEKKILKGTPTGGLARMISIMESGLCSRVDVYGYSSGGGKYFARSAVVKEAHVINIEHYLRRVIMAAQLHGKVCIYGE